MKMPVGTLGDALGPRGRRRVNIASAIAATLLGYALWVAFGRLSATGELDAKKWQLLAEPEVLRFLLVGLGNTLKVAAVALVLATTIGGILALARLSRTVVLRFISRTVTEFFRAFPILLLIFFAFFGLPVLGIGISRFWSLTLALALYNGAVLGEIFRAGILSLDRGQGEAASSLGLPYWPAMRIVILPQAVRRMTPTLISQAITLLKDSSLGFVVSYEELLRAGQIAGQFGRNELQTLTVVALFYLIVNFSLSRMARHLEVRQRRRYSAGSIQVAGPEDLVAVDVGKHL